MRMSGLIRLLCAALGVTVVAQWAFLWRLGDIPTGTLALLVVLNIGLTCMALGTVAAVWLAHRRGTSPASNAVTRWLENIDISGEQRPEPAFRVDSQDSELVAAAESLVARVHRYRDKLLVRHQRVQRLLRNVTDVLYHIDADGRITWITDTVTDMLGYSPAELEGLPLRDLLADPATDFDALVRSPYLVRHPTRIRRRDGSLAWLLISSRRIDDAEGRPIGSEGVCRDGTRLIETQRELNAEKERAQVTLASIGDGVITTDARGAIDYVNPRAERMLGLQADQAIARHFDSVCRLRNDEREEIVTGLVEECIADGEAREWDNHLTLAMRGPSREEYALKVTISPIRDDAQAIVGTVIVLHDITRLQQISREMTYQANHDLLTGLPNRRAFEHMLDRFLRDTRNSVQRHALCYLDLDQFKLVNDTCGHHAGDEMLRQISTQIAARLRGEDTIARLGGDEFGVIMRNLSLEDAAAKAETLRAEIDTFRFRWEDKLFRLGVSIGVTAIDHQALSASELMRRADTACYLAKERGRNQIHVYHGDSDETLTWHGEMQRMQQISEALEHERFSLFAQRIQPLSKTETDRPGIELLLRIPDAEDGLDPQNVLITAERYNVASRIDRWVLENALALIAGAERRQARIDHYSINISGQSITDEQFVDFARDCIERSGVDPGRLVFEITETAAVTNTRRAGELIHSLRAIGCRFSLDDFGSGLSSFSYLKNLPSDFIKIDGKLVRHILDDPIERSIVEAINQVGQAMGLKTVAEHVESRALLQALERIGVDYVQGYHVARPMAFAEIADELCAPGAAATSRPAAPGPADA